MTKRERILHALTPKKAWFRFSTRTLLIAFTLISFALGTLGVYWYREYRHEMAVTEIKEIGGQVVADDHGGVERVYIANPEFDDDALAQLLPHLHFLRGLKELDLVKTPITDESLPQLIALPAVEEVYLFETNISAQAIAQFAEARPTIAVKLEAPDPVASSLAATNIYRHAIVALAVDTGPTRFVTGSGDGMLRWWTLSPFEQSRPTRAHAEWTFAAALSPDGKLLATGGGDDLVKLWDASSHDFVATLTGHQNDVHAVAFDATGRTLYSAGDDRTLRRWDLHTGGPSLIVGDHAEPIPTLAVHPQTGVVASGSRDDTIRLWDASNASLLLTLDGHSNDVMALAYSPDGRLLASASYDGAVRLWDSDDGQPVGILTGHTDRVYSVAFDSAGATLASGGAAGVIAWDVRTHEVQFRYDDVENASRVYFTPDGRFLLVTDAAGFVHVLDPQRGFRLRKIPTARAYLAIGSARTLD